MSRIISVEDLMDAFMSPECRGVLNALTPAQTVIIEQRDGQNHISVQVGAIAMQTVAGLIVALGLGTGDEVMTWACSRQGRMLDNMLDNIEIDL